MKSNRSSSWWRGWWLESVFDLWQMLIKQQSPTWVPPSLLLSVHTNRLTLRSSPQNFRWWHWWKQWIWKLGSWAAYSKFWNRSLHKARNIRRKWCILTVQIPTWPAIVPCNLFWRIRSILGGTIAKCTSLSFCFFDLIQCPETKNTNKKYWILVRLPKGFEIELSWDFAFWHEILVIKKYLILLWGFYLWDIAKILQIPTINCSLWN